MSGTIGSHGIPGRAVRCAPRYAPALLLAILLCLSAALAACGGESSGPTPTHPSNPSALAGSTPAG